MSPVDSRCLTLVPVDNFPEFSLAGKVALVTGSARGLGRAISLALAHAGADVSLGLREINAHGGLPGEIEALGRRALPLQMDMVKMDEVFQAVERTVAHFGRLDILVNNAGIAPGNLAENVREEDCRYTAWLNQQGPLRFRNSQHRRSAGQRRCRSR